MIRITPQQKLNLERAAKRLGINESAAPNRLKRPPTPLRL
jgi:hypothetical protein